MSHMLNCPICNHYFEARRSDAVYCSAKCRKAAGRTGTRGKDEKQSLYNQAVKDINRLISMDAQNQLKALVLQAVEAMNDSTRKKVYDALNDDFYRIRDVFSHR